MFMLLSGAEECLNLAEELHVLLSGSRHVELSIALITCLGWWQARRTIGKC
jgi:hypothetical protein